MNQPNYISGDPNFPKCRGTFIQIKTWRKEMGKYMKKEMKEMK